MPLKLMTITGADEATDPHDLEDMSREYPFVEWAFLLSTNKTGQEARYPALRYLAAAGKSNIRKAVHLCGSLARCAAEDTGWAIETALTMVAGARRVQINLGRGIDQYPGLWRALREKTHAVKVQIILQAYDFEIPTVQAATGAYSVDGAEDGKVVFLHDASGGRGIVTNFQPPNTSNFTGYAGGINPDNIEAKLAEAHAFCRNPFWIDVESGVRTDDRLDLGKVRQVLEAAKHYIA